MNDDLATLFAYNRWADARMLDACRLVPAEEFDAEIVPGWTSLRSTVAHIAWATEIWARRLLGRPVEMFAAESETPDIDGAARILDAAHADLEGLIAASPPEVLAAPFTYRNLRGQETTLPLWAALRHVVNHATYHRGQVATKLRRLGVDPPVTDLVIWAAEQFAAGKLA